MESPKPNEKRRLVSQEAAYWWIRVEDRQLTRADRRQLVAWLKQSPENIAEILRVMQLDRSATRPVHALLGMTLHSVCEIASHPLQNSRSTAPPRPKHETRELLSLALSSTYFAHFRKANRPARWALGGVSLLIFVAAILGFPGVLPVAGFSVTFLTAVALKEAVVRYRVSHGLFGSTAAEARLLLQFIIQNSTTIDFDDHNGKPRRIFESPAQCTGRQEIPAGAITE